MADFVAAQYSIDEIASKLDSLETAIQNYIANGNSPVVKHIQRGTFQLTSGNSTTTGTLSGFTNIDKMIVLINGSGHYEETSNYWGYARLPYLKTLATSSMTVGTSSAPSKNETCGYQVIEFY